MDSVNFASEKITLDANINVKNYQNIEDDIIKKISSFKNGKITIDLINIDNPDSLVLAILLSCLRQANKNKNELLFINWSLSLLNLAKLCELDKIFTNIA